MPWLWRQWREISGNAKFWIVLGVMIAVTDWIRNGPAWQVFGVMFLWIIALFLLLVGAKTIYKWCGWSLLIVGAVISVFSIASHEIKRSEIKSITATSQYNLSGTNRVIGDGNTVVGNVRLPNMGNGNTLVGPTDDRGNTILTNPVAIGYGAKGGPGAVVIGANAGIKDNSENIGKSIDRSPDSINTIDQVGNNTLVLGPKPFIASQHPVAINVFTNGVYLSSFSVQVANPTKESRLSFTRVPQCTLSNTMVQKATVGLQTTVVVKTGLQESHPSNYYEVTSFTSCPVKESDFGEFFLNH